MSTASTSSIRPSTTQHEAGAEAAPIGIVVHSCTTIGDTILVVHLGGEIDHFSAGPAGETRLRSLDGYTALALYTSQVTFRDSGFLSVLEWWTRPGRRLRMESCSSAVEHLLCAAARISDWRLLQTGGDRVGEPPSGSPTGATQHSSPRWAVPMSAAGMS